MRARNLSRRDLLAASGASALAAGLAGCGGAGSFGSFAGGAAPTYTVGRSLLEADRTGTLYALDPVARTVSRLAGDGSAVWTTPPDTMGMPAAVAFDADGRVFVADAGRHEILVLDPDGAEVGRIGRHGDGATEFRTPLDVAIDESGRLYVCDALNHRIQVLHVEGGLVDVIAPPPGEDGALNGPRALALDAVGDLHVVDGGNRRIVVFDRDGEFSRAYAHEGDGGLVQPRDVVIDASGTRYVVDAVARCVQSFDPLVEWPTGCFEPTRGDGRIVTPLRATLDPAGGLFLAA